MIRTQFGFASGLVGWLAIFIASGNAQPPSSDSEVSRSLARLERADNGIKATIRIDSENPSKASSIDVLCRDDCYVIEVDLDSAPARWVVGNSNMFFVKKDPASGKWILGSDILPRIDMNAAYRSLVNHSISKEEQHWFGRIFNAIDPIRRPYCFTVLNPATVLGERVAWRAAIDNGATIEYGFDLDSPLGDANTSSVGVLTLEKSDGYRLRTFECTNFRDGEPFSKTEHAIKYNGNDSRSYSVAKIETGYKDGMPTGPSTVQTWYIDKDPAEIDRAIFTLEHYGLQKRKDRPAGYFVMAIFLGGGVSLVVFAVYLRRSS